MPWTSALRPHLACLALLTLPTGALGMSYLPFLDWAPGTAAGKDRPGIAREGQADRVVVKKAERRLYLMRGEHVLQSYAIALGFQPIGHKEREGDGRTPEGRYQLDRRQSRSRFHRALHVSYPSPVDRTRAARRGVPPGGLIMLHGQPNASAGEPSRLEDWTHGCIAVSNAEIEDIWTRTVEGTPIEILP
jgi:murein L,D-transpeptidase YafK